jgi:hypothetical protein
MIELFPRVMEELDIDNIPNERTGANSYSNTSLCFNFSFIKPSVKLEKE